MTGEDPFSDFVISHSFVIRASSLVIRFHSVMLRTRQGVW